MTYNRYDLDGEMLNDSVVPFAVSVVHVSLFTGTDASVHLGDDAPTQHLEDYHPGARVHDLFGGGSVGFVPDLLPRGQHEVKVNSRYASDAGYTSRYSRVHYSWRG